MATLSDVLDDFDASLTRVSEADQEDELRRALNEALSVLYALRENLKNQIGTGAYLDSVRSGSPVGRVTEGLVGVRAVATHNFTKSVEPRTAMLYPGVNVYPGHEVFPGVSLQWVAFEDLSPESAELLRQKKDQGGYYRDHLAGRSVMSTMLEARLFVRGEAV